MEQLSEEAKKMMALAGIKESDKKFLTNESFSEKNKNEEKSESNKDSDFTTIKFQQAKVEPGPEDSLYKLD
jgi:hypothetical protein